MKGRGEEGFSLHELVDGRGQSGLILSGREKHDA